MLRVSTVIKLFKKSSIYRNPVMSCQKTALPHDHILLGNFDLSLKCNVVYVL